ncbi:MAG: ABC transporter permease [Alloprevotella sp.]
MFTFFLARRFFRANGGESGQRASTPAIRIATAGIAVGLAVMIVSVCVVKGFQHQVSDKLTGFASHLSILDIHSFGSPESYPVVTDSALIRQVRQAPGVAKVQRVSQKMGIFKTQNDFSGVSLKGVAQDYDLSFMRQSIVAGRMPEFRDDRASDSIVVSRMLADKLGLKVGDRIYSYFFSQTIKQRRFTVAAIYDTHLRQFDNAFVLTDLYTVNKLNGWTADQSSGLEVQLTSFGHLPAARQWLARHIGGRRDRMQHTYSVVSIRENPQTASVLSWLGLLDFNVMVILIIMVCVAGFTMVSGLLILILERTATIGVLKALGATNARVRHTFLWFAAFIVGRGMLIGNLIGLGLISVQWLWQPVRLNPDTYYIDAVPVELNAWWLLALNAATLCLTMLSLVLPSLLVSRVQPAKAIQFD